MSDDLIHSLREAQAGTFRGYPWTLAGEAADEIERLRAELKHVYELRATEAHDDQEMVERLEDNIRQLRALLARCRQVIIDNRGWQNYPVLLADLDAALKKDKE